MTPDQIREFEKTGKTLMRLKGTELLFEEDTDGRMKYACWAMNSDDEKLQNMIDEIMKTENGIKHIVRALNNIAAIGHKGALNLSRLLFCAAESSYSPENRVRKLIQICDSVDENLRCGMDWISKKAADYLDASEMEKNDRVELWLHWCRAMLRSGNDAGLFVRTLGSSRPIPLQKSTVNALRDDVNNDHAPWDQRAAALYLLLGNKLISLEKAQSFVENAYAGFPLEALEGVELLQYAVDCDDAEYAEFNVIQDKLAQLRKENLILKHMAKGDFWDASNQFFAAQNDMPKTAIQLATSLHMLDKSQRIIASILIDDTRKSEWMAIAVKTPAELKPFAALFFENFNAENELLTTFGIDLAETLLECCNVDATLTQSWVNAAENGDIDELNHLRHQWALALH